MVFDTLIKLNSIISEGFLINKIISIFSNSEKLELNKGMSKENREILKNALKYVELIKKGRTSILEEVFVKDLDESLDVFNTTLNALDQSEKNLTFERFNKIIDMSEDQISKSLNSDKIIEENLEFSLILFEAIRKYLIKEAGRIFY